LYDNDLEELPLITLKLCKNLHCIPSSINNLTQIYRKLEDTDTEFSNNIIFELK
jgi:hypothetical protein